MKKTSSLFLGLSLAVSCVSMAAAQDQSMTPMKPPKYLQVLVLYLERPAQELVVARSWAGRF